MKPNTDIIKGMKKDIEPELVLHAEDGSARDAAILGDPYDYQVALAAAQTDGVPYLIVSDDLMTRLTKSKEMSSFTTGRPGVRIYREGKKEELDEIEDMSADTYREYVAKKALANRKVK